MVNVDVAMAERQPKLFSVKEAAAVAGVSPRTIWNWISRGLVDYGRLPSGRVRIFPGSLLRVKRREDGRPGN